MRNGVYVSIIDTPINLKYLL